MTVSRQLEIIRGIFKSRISGIYRQEFFLKLMAVMKNDRKWFEDQLSLIDLLSALVEAGIMSSNPRRALRYLCVLDDAVTQLSRRVDSIYASKPELAFSGQNAPAGKPGNGAVPWSA